jgi:hypothetical protein
MNVLLLALDLHLASHEADNCADQQSLSNNLNVWNIIDLKKSFRNFQRGVRLGPSLFYVWHLH